MLSHPENSVLKLHEDTMILLLFMNFYLTDFPIGIKLFEFFFSLVMMFMCCFLKNGPTFAAQKNRFRFSFFGIKKEGFAQVVDTNLSTSDNVS